jgi:hypothetical protein
VYQLGQLVNNDHDGVETMRGLWERANKVHCDSLPGFRWDRQGLEKACRKLITWLISLA